MALGLRKSGANRLSLVRGSVKALVEPRVVSNDKLTNSQAKILQEYIRKAQLTGMCVGALVASEEWDVRPLVVERGQLTITRFTNPDTGSIEVGVKNLRTTLMKLSSFSFDSGLLNYGTSDDQIWARRRFYQNTMYDLATGISGMPARHRLRRVRAILQAIESFHKCEIFHGHLCAANLAWDGERPLFLDIGFACNTGNKEFIEDLAPEIRQGSIVNSSTDIFGLGLIISEILPREAFLEEYDIIERMLSEDLLARPTVNEAIDFFIESEHTWQDKQFSARSKKSIVKVDNLLDVISERPPVIAPPPPVLKPIEQEEVFDDIDAEAEIQAAGRTFIFSAVTVLILLGVWAFHQPIARYFSRSGQQIVGSFEELWQSGQPSLMQVVAQEAIEGKNRMAQSVIISSVMQGKSPIRVKTDLLRFVFNPTWEEQLSEDDRLLVLSLALVGLKETTPDFEALLKAHPIVLLGIVGTLNVDVEVPALARVPITQLIKLPAPYNTVFSEIAKVKATNLSDISVRSAAHLILGVDAQDQMLQKYFSNSQNDLEIFRYLRGIIPLFNNRPGLDVTTYTHLLLRSKVFAQTSRWFDDEPLAKWDELNRGERLGILAGMFPKTPLSFERLCDLMKFPNPKVAQDAAKELRDRFYGPKLESLLSFMSSRQNSLTRAQTISIMAALPLTGNEADNFFARWFGGNPDPNSVLSIMLIRTEAPKNDIFNIQAANYLANTQIDLPFNKLEKLILHPEPLARALAYSHMRKQDPQELKLLKSMAIAEPDKKLRETIKLRLND